MSGKKIPLTTQSTRKISVTASAAIRRLGRPVFEIVQHLLFAHIAVADQQELQQVIVLFLLRTTVRFQRHADSPVSGRVKSSAAATDRWTRFRAKRSSPAETEKKEKTAKTDAARRPESVRVPGGGVNDRRRTRERPAKSRRTTTAIGIWQARRREPFVIRAPAEEAALHKHMIGTGSQRQTDRGQVLTLITLIDPF